MCTLFYTILAAYFVSSFQSHTWTSSPFDKWDRKESMFNKPKRTEDLSLQYVLPSCEHCLISVFLLNDVNLLPVATPITINKYLSAFQENNAKKVPVKIGHQVETNGSLEISLNNRSQIVCSSSYFLTRRGCTNLVFKTFSVNIKTWNIEQHIYLLPSYMFGKIRSLWSENHNKMYTFLGRTVVGFIIYENLRRELLYWTRLFQSQWELNQFSEDNNLVIFAVAQGIPPKQSQTYIMFPLYLKCATIILINRNNFDSSFLQIKQYFERQLVDSQNITTWGYMGFGN